MDQDRPAHHVSGRQPQEDGDSQGPEGGFPPAADFPKVREKKIKDSDASAVDPVVDYAEDQDDLPDHQGCRTVQVNGMGVERGEKVDCGSVEDVDGQEEQGAQAGQPVQQEAELALLSAITG